MSDEEDYQARQSELQEYMESLQRQVTVTPQDVANRLHNEMYRNGKPHSMVHSCPCYNLALFYLGITESHGLHWPDGKGGNAWDRKSEVKDQEL